MYWVKCLRTGSICGSTSAAKLQSLSTIVRPFTTCRLSQSSSVLGNGASSYATIQTHHFSFPSQSRTEIPTQGAIPMKDLASVIRYPIACYSQCREPNAPHCSKGYTFLEVDACVGVIRHNSAPHPTQAQLFVYLYTDRARLLEWRAVESPPICHCYTRLAVGLKK